MKLSPVPRKALLTLHVVTAVGWLGVSAVLTTLAIAGLGGADPTVVYPAIGLIGTTLLVPLAVTAWAVGVLTSLFSKWGLFGHWWVTTKLLLTTVLTVLVLFLLWPTLRQAADPSVLLSPDERRQLVIGPSVSTVAMIVATVLSTYKPWGRLRRRARRNLSVHTRQPSLSPTIELVGRRNSE